MRRETEVDDRDKSEKGGDEDLPHRDQQRIEHEADRNRREVEAPPPHGTDPLHEGP